MIEKHDEHVPTIVDRYYRYNKVFIVTLTFNSDNKNDNVILNSQKT